MDITAGIGSVIASICTLILGIATLIQANVASRKAERAATVSLSVAEETNKLNEIVKSQLAKFSDAEVKRGDAEGYMRAMIENAVIAKELISQNKAEAASVLLASVTADRDRSNRAIQEMHKDNNNNNNHTVTPVEVVNTPDNPALISVVKKEKI